MDNELKILKGLGRLLDEFRSSEHKIVMRRDFWRSLYALWGMLSSPEKIAPAEYAPPADNEECLLLLSQVVQKLSNLSDVLEQCVPDHPE